MVDRVTVYAGQIPLETDLLKTGQNGMVGLAKFCAAVLGSTTIVNGFTCTPTGPASLNVIVTAGEVYQLENLEQSTWSSLSTDTHTILKQGVVLDPTTFGITPPGTVGFSQNFLIEAQYQDVDAGSTVLPYFNAANPSIPFSGPGNAGTAQNTVRKGVAALQVKAGIAATTGTQTTPTADAGWVGMFVVTVANGATTITSGNITQLLTAPFIPCTLPNVPVTDQSGIWTYAADTGTVNNLVVTLSPVPASYTTGMAIRVKLANTPTGATVINVNGLGNKSVTHIDGGAILPTDLVAGQIALLVFDGTNFQVVGLPQGAPGPVVLTSNRDYYVNTSTGSDTLYDGTSATVSGIHGPFRTVQKGINTASSFNLNGFTVTVHIATGNYSENLELNIINGNGSIVVIGDETTPANVTINPATGPCVHWGGTFATFGYTLKGLKLTAAANGTNPGYGIYGGAGGVTIQNMEFGACIAAHINITGGGALTINGHGDGVSGPTGIRISGSAPTHISVTLAGRVTLYQPDLTITTPVNFSANFWNAADLSMITGTYFSITNPGNVTATKFNVITNAVIDTSGAGTSYLPGGSAGTTATGGQYA